MEMKNDQMQKIRMCIQTYFNLYGVVPDVQVIREWLGASCGGSCFQNHRKE